MYKSFLIIIIFAVNIVFGQPVFESNEASIYGFLEKMDVKGIIQFEEYVKPILRNDIKKYLIRIDNSKLELLSHVEIEELNWYLKEYGDKENLEMGSISDGLFSGGLGDISKYYYYQDNKFTFNFSPSVMIDYGSSFSETLYKQYWGWSFYGYSDNLGFNGNFRENFQKGENIDKRRHLSDERGFIISSSKKDNIEFSSTNGSITYANSNFLLSFIKDDYSTGGGINSQFVLSGKSPSFPSIYYRYNPVDWLRFYFIHGWLFSGVIDSSASYITDFDGKRRWIEREKYFVMHALQLRPFRFIDITLGETLIYSDRNIYWGYFIPFLFFRSVDHMFTYGSGDSGNNGSFFGEVAIRPYERIKLSASLFIDEFSLKRFIKGDFSRNQLGYQANLRYYGLGFINSMLTIEYTRILPWIYQNWIPTQTYTNSGYLLGHYIGQNSDQLFFDYTVYPMRGLSLGLSFDYNRRGGNGTVTEQYRDPVEEFLYGNLRHEAVLGVYFRYEYRYGIFINGYYKFSNISDEDAKRTPAWQLGKKHSFGLGLSYGM